MRCVRWILFGCLVVSLAGCSVGKKDRANSSKSGAGRVSPAEESPTYPWARPSEDLQRPQLPLKSPGNRDPF